MPSRSGSLLFDFKIWKTNFSKRYDLPPAPNPLDFTPLFCVLWQDLIKKAISVAKSAQIEWDRVPIQEKVSIWRRAADLMASKYRMELNASTMAGQSKTVIQAEIDSSAELIDFVR